MDYLLGQGMLYITMICKMQHKMEYGFHHTIQASTYNSQSTILTMNNVESNNVVERFKVLFRDYIPS